MFLETIEELSFVWVISAFVGLVVGQFVEPREMLITIIGYFMVGGTILLLVYYSILAYREWKREQKKNRRNFYRGGYIR